MNREFNAYNLARNAYEYRDDTGVFKVIKEIEDELWEESLKGRFNKEISIYSFGYDFEENERLLISEHFINKGLKITLLDSDTMYFEW